MDKTPTTLNLRMEWIKHNASWLVLSVYLFVGLGIFGYSLGFGFLLDDEDQILKNGFIQSLSHFFDLFMGSTMNPGGAAHLSGIYYKPIMMLSYMILWFITPGDALSFHVFQFLLHVANAFLIYRLFRHVFSLNNGNHGSHKDNGINVARTTLAFVLGLIFVVHPINVSSVVYIANLQENLFSFFGLAALNLLATTGTLNTRMIVAVGSLFLLSLLSKESGILYLVVSIPYCLIFIPSKVKQLIKIQIVTIATYLFLRLGLAHLTVVSFNTSKMHRADLATRLMTMPKILWHYVETFFFPKDLTVTQDWVVTEFSLGEFWFPLVCMTLFSSIIIILNQKRPSKVLLFFTIWAIIGLGMHSQLVPLDGTVSDRWFYFPIVGFLGILSTLVPSHFGKTASAAILVACLIPTLGARSLLRTLNWSDGLTLYQHDLRLMPDSYYLNNNVGVELFRRNRIPESRPYFEKSTELFPAWTVNWNNLGAVYESSNDLPAAETCFHRSIQNGVYHLAFENYARVLFKQAKYSELRVFLTQVGLKILPNNPILQQIYGALPPD